LDFKRVEPKKLYLQVAEHLMAGVRDGRLSRGAKLPSDRDLSAQMRVSRPTVREALIALELLGVVEMRAGQGTFVVGGPSSLEALGDTRLASPFEVIEARAAVEAGVVMLLARKWQTGQLNEGAYSRTRKITETMKALVSRDDKADEFLRLGLDFHKALAEACGNETLSRMVGELADFASQPLWTLANQKIVEDRTAREDQIEEHEAVLEAIERGDSGLAQEAMSHHLSELSKMALEY